MFFVIITLLTLVSGLMVVWPLLRREADPSILPGELSRQVYKDRRDELAADLAAGQIDTEEYASLQAELARTLLAESEASSLPMGQAAPRLSAWVTWILLSTGALGLYLGVFFQAGLLHWWQMQELIGKDVDAVVSGQPPAAHPKYSLADFVRVLETRAQRDPSRSVLWAGLGMSYLQLQAPAFAAVAFERADHLEPGRPDLELALAQSRFYASDGELDADTRQMLETLLQKYPENDGARLLLAVSSFNANDFQRSATLYQELVNRLGVRIEAKERQDLEARLAEAEQKLKESRSQAKVAASIHVTLDIAASVRSSLSDAVVFVFAKAVSGPPVPLAVARYPVAQLPSEIVLDDSLAMMPALRLSEFSRVKVSALLSRRGEARPQTGDVESIPQEIAVAPEQHLHLKLDQVHR